MFRRGKRSDNDFREEIEVHIDLETERLIEEGMEPEEARHAARRTFGNMTGARERFYESRRSVWLSQLWQDLRYAARLLKKDPGFTSVVVLTLALGIGVNSAIFSLVDAVLLKSLPVESPDELFVVTTNVPNGQYGQYPPDMYEAFQEVTTGIAELVGMGYTHPWEVRYLDTGGDMTEPATGQVVTGNFFIVLGVPAAIGRTLTPDDDRVGELPVAMISHRYWTRRFGGDPAVLGRSFVIGDTEFVIVGAAPQGFFGARVGQAPDLWVPAATRPLTTPGVAARTKFNRFWIEIIGRPNQGVSREQVIAAVSVPFQQNLDEILVSNERSMRRSWLRVKISSLETDRSSAA